MRDAVHSDFVFDGLGDYSTPHWNSCLYNGVCYDSLRGRIFKHNLLLKMLTKWPAHNVAQASSVQETNKTENLVLRPYMVWGCENIISRLDRIQHHFHGKCSNEHVMLLYFSLYKI